MLSRNTQKSKTINLSRLPNNVRNRIAPKKVRARRKSVKNDIQVVKFKNQLKEAKLKGKLKRTQMNRALRRERLDARAERGGLTGHFARKLQTKIAKGNADVEIEKMKPGLYGKERKTAIETEAVIKQTKARGAAAAAVASALGGSYAAKSSADAEAVKARAKADEEVAKALESSLNTVPSVTTDPYSNKSVSGLVTGVR